MLLDKIPLRAALQTLQEHFRLTLLATWRAGGSRPQLGLAISGGVDSMALASLCGELAKTESQCPSFAGLIVDHQLRKNSRVEADKVAAELERLSIRPVILTIDWTQHGDPSSLRNLESVARRLRYQALGTGCRQQNITSLMVAHHADDQAETVLLRMLGGYVGSGLIGMREKSAQLPECGGMYGISQSGTPIRGRRESRSMPVEGGGVTIDRPLLPFTKALLTSHCQEAGVRWFEDHTNADRTFTLRNTVRYLLQSNDLPLPIQKPRLLSLACEVQTRENEMEHLAQQMFEHTDIRLSTETGRAHVDFTDVCKMLSAAAVSAKGHTLKAILLRKILRLVSPKDVIPLQHLHEAVNLMFPPDDRISPPSASSRDRSKILCQVAGVAVFYGNQASDAVRVQYILQRDIPVRDVAVSQHKTLALPHEHHGSHQDSHLASAWLLWDNRYWIRVHGRPNNEPAVKEIAVKFLNATNLTALRQTMSNGQRKRLSRLIGAARDHVRFTLPIIVTRSDKTQSSHDAISGEQIVAIPTLRWSASGWDEWRDGDSNAVKCEERQYWEIRYKHVGFPVSDSHQLVSPGASIESSFKTAKSPDEVV